MGKIVKYCAACEESFAQRFGFCPNCGGTLKAFEMNPVQEETKVAADKTVETAKAPELPKVSAPENNSVAAPPSTKTYENSPKIEPAVVTAFSTNGNSANGKATKDVQPFSEKVILEQPVVKAKVPEISDTQKVPAKQLNVETKPLAATAAAGVSGNVKQNQVTTHNYQPTNNGQKNLADDGFHVTVIEEKNVGQRNLLLLGAMFFMMSLVVGGVVYSLYNKDLLVGAINSEDFISVPVVGEDPMEVKDEQPKPKIDKSAGGGGGGGREEQTPTSKGRLATQMPDPPLITPTKTIPQKDFELKMQATTQGNKPIKATDEPYGDPNSKYTLSSDGMGSGRGQGSGQGTGQGSGRGTGAGSGIGSGFGGGVGDGTGNGKGTGREGASSPPPPPPSAPVGPTTAVVITSKPHAQYTDAARQNQFTGTVTLRVTFLASGQIGSISPVSTAPYGLTEQAIAAARQMRFEPAKKSGVPQTVTKQVQYSFTLY